MDTFKFPTGTNFHLSSLVPADELSGALRRFVEFIQDYGGYRRFRVYHDWWQHDGLHFYRSSINLNELSLLVGSPQHLVDAMPDDDCVRIGIASEKGDWYLRIYTIWGEGGPLPIGEFDVTLPEPLAALFREEVVARIGLTMDEEPAHSYYSRIKAGR